MTTANLDPGRLERLGIPLEPALALVERLRSYVERGRIPSGQIALARHGEVAVSTAFGEATQGGRRLPVSPRTLYPAFSTTKAITSAAAWILLQEERLELDDRVADHLPGFEAHGKAEVRVLHLLIHTAGFPDATLDVAEWADPHRRFQRFASWTLDWKPGERFQYHSGATMWVLAALIEKVTRCDFRAFVRERIAEPLGLEDLHLGLPPGLDDRVADLEVVGEASDPEKLGASGIAVPEQMGSQPELLLRFNDPALRAVGVPGGGAILNAESLALFYQGILNDGCGPTGRRVFEREILVRALRVHSGELLDPMTGRRAERGLGVVLAGGDDRVFRAFAAANSERAFGHAGAGGQVAWADPASGLSFVYMTNGMERDPLAMGSRGMTLSAAATACAPGRPTG